MRYWFGGQPADYVISPGEQVPVTDETLGYQPILVPGVTLWVYEYDTGDRTTDLLDDSGNQVDHLISGDFGGLPRFRGPDEARRLLVGPEPTGNGGDDGGEDDDGEGEEQQDQWIITTTDWPTIVNQLDDRVSSLEDGSGGGEDPDPVGSAHPLLWTHPNGLEEDRTSPHPVWNLEGRSQRVTAARAQATIESGELTVSVLRIDPDTGDTSTLAALQLDEDNQYSTVTPDASVSDGTGLTVRVEMDDEDDEISDVTVQVMIR